jgi:hypothetical protein
MFKLAQYVKTDCNITHPILKNNKCYSIYCSPQDYNSSVCTINNSIVKIQWLTNIIQISEVKFRYINPFFTKNKDFIIQTTSALGTSKRRYYGLTMKEDIISLIQKEKKPPIIQLMLKGVMKMNYTNMKALQPQSNLKMMIMIIF